MSPGGPPGDEATPGEATSGKAASGGAAAAGSGETTEDAPGDVSEDPSGGTPGAVPEASGEAPGEDAAERWLDEQAGPLVRPYVMTRGRTEPLRGTFDLITMVVATAPAAPGLGLAPEPRAVLRLCAQPMSVAEIAGHLRLPTVTVRVLLGDLLDEGLISIEEPRTETDLADDDDMYQAVIDGLHAL